MIQAARIRVVLEFTPGLLVDGICPVNPIPTGWINRKVVIIVTRPREGKTWGPINNTATKDTNLIDTAIFINHQQPYKNTG